MIVVLDELGVALPLDNEKDLLRLLKKHKAKIIFKKKYQTYEQFIDPKFFIKNINIPIVFYKILIRNSEYSELYNDLNKLSCDIIIKR